MALMTTLTLPSIGSQIQLRRVDWIVEVAIEVVSFFQASRVAAGVDFAQEELPRDSIPITRSSTAI